MRKIRVILWLLILCLCLASCTSLVTIPEEQAPSSEVLTEGELRIHVIDVGQGDSTFVELPGGATLLIDAGERENGESVADYVRRLGYERIDHLVGTHPHSDHIGGLQRIVEGFEIGKIYMPKKSSTTATFKNLLTAIQKKGLKVESAKAGKVIAEGEGLSVTILSPVGEDYGDEMNLYSVVVSITYGEKRFLFMGDAETENEAEMRDVSADFIRVGHHGSRTSSGAEFVRRVGAQIAVVSVGKDNSYGLPKQDVLDRWEEAGATLYRTDEAGTLVFESDGKSITVGKSVFADKTEETETPATKWVLNISSKKIHYPDCSGVSAMKAENKSESDKTIAQLLEEGYTVCGTCDPVEG